MEQSTKNALPILVGLVIVVLIGGAMYVSQSKAPVVSGDEEVVIEDPEESVGTAMDGTYTMAEVQAHNSAASCWSVVDGNVYDLTKWIAEHPGGPGGILGICGKDGTTAFRGQHGNAKLQNEILATYKIGAVAE